MFHYGRRNVASKFMYPHRIPCGATGTANTGLQAGRVVVSLKPAELAANNFCGFETARKIEAWATKEFAGLVTETVYPT